MMLNETHPQADTFSPGPSDFWAQAAASGRRCGLSGEVASGLFCLDELERRTKEGQHREPPLKDPIITRGPVYSDSPG